MVKTLYFEVCAKIFRKEGVASLAKVHSLTPESPIKFKF
jgi:hypothetical protein